MTVEKSKSRSLIARVSKLLFVGLGAVAILLAVALGVFRLLVAQIPEYQSEIKAWVAAEIGLEVDFAALDARLGLTGPELTLHGASIGSGTEFLQADEATIAFDAIALVFSRHIEFTRLTLDGVRLTVDRDAEGRLRVGDFALQGGGDGLVGSIPESLVVAIRNSELRYVDALPGRTFSFSDLDIEIESAAGIYTASGSARPPQGLAESLEIELNGRLVASESSPANVRLRASVETLDLEALAMFLPPDLKVPVGGTGDIAAEIEWLDAGIEGVQVDLDFGRVQLYPEQDEPYERLRFAAAWQGGPNDWQLTLSDLIVGRAGQLWQPGSIEFSMQSDDLGLRAVALRGDYFRLEDLAPLVFAFPETQIAEQWALFEPAGVVADLDFALERRNSSFDYDLDATFDRIAVRRVGDTPGIQAVSGRVEANEDSGTVDFQSGEIRVDWPSLFRERLDAQSLTGHVVWRQSQDTVQVLSSNLRVGVLGREAAASFDLKIPRDGSSPTLDITAELDEAPLVQAKQFLPTEIMPAAVVGWLDQAVIGGVASEIELNLYGPLAAFPFDDGEGQFEVTATIDDATLAYMSEWPLGEDVSGEIAFLNAGFFASAAGEAFGNRTDNLELAIPDMRLGHMSLGFEAEGALADVVGYLNSVPLIAAQLGPGFDRIEVLDGGGSISAMLELPLNDRSAFTVDAALGIEAGHIRVRGLKPEIYELSGVLIATEDAVSADGIEGVFLEGPFTASLAPSIEPGYRAELNVEGETAAQSVAEVFGWQHGGLVDGQALWRGSLLLPVLDPLATTSTRISVESNLSGVALRLPEPLSKQPSAASNLGIELVFASGNRVDLAGNLDATRFAFQFGTDNDVLSFRRGAIVFGGIEPRLPVQTGFLVSGQVDALELDDWLSLGRQAGMDRAGPQFLGADVEVASFEAFGQHLGHTSLRVEREDELWQIDVNSEAIAGQILVPRGGGRQSPIVADMDRFYLAAGGSGGSGGLGGVDPRSLPGMRLSADEFGVGNRQLGAVEAEIRPDATGLVLTRFSSRTDHFNASITGSWRRQAVGTQTRLSAQIESTDVASALAELGLDPVVEGEAAFVDANVYFNAAPAGDWLDHLHGEVSLFVETGTLREVDPGAGRVVGLMSIAALPRRLLLDFRDVFEEGFAFDEISGTFRVIDGNAYTNDLKFGGPAAEIGVVGRTGLRDRDYRQQVVVTAEPGKMLPTVGGLLGGAGVGAALLIFTRLFKEPLKGIGRASYCLTGSWEAPAVETIDEDERDQAVSCADLPDEMRPQVTDD